MMSTKGYVFCFLMAIAAVLSWFRPIMTAQAATQPSYEYAIVPVQVGTEGLVRVLNVAGAKGWRSAGGACVRYDNVNPNTFCDNTLLIRERH